VSDPYIGYRFHVSLAPPDAYLPPQQASEVPAVLAAGFQEVSGLGGELEVMAFAEGGTNDHMHQLPVRHSWSRISLRRGITNDSRLWAWYQAGLFQSLGARRDGTIMLLGEDGLPLMAWLFQGGLAVKWSGPALNSSQSMLAIEALEIAHEGILQVDLA
jgi:phage tail-like protein